MISGYYYELIQFTVVSGTMLTLSAPLKVDFPIGAFVRDQNFFPGAIRDSNAPCPIIDTESDELPPGLPQTNFKFAPDFFEDVSV